MTKAAAIGGFYTCCPGGETLARLTRDVNTLSGFISGTLVCLTAAGAVAMMVHRDAALALLVSALVPVYVLILKLMGCRMRDLAMAEETLRVLEVVHRPASLCLADRVIKIGGGEKLAAQQTAA